MSLTDAQAKNIVNAVLRNLDDRRGIYLSDLKPDKEVYDEMYASLVADTKKAADSDADPATSYWYPED